MWDGLQSWRHIGSILTVNWRSGDVEVSKVNAVCKFIEQIIVLLIMEKRAIALGGGWEMLAAITVEILAPFLWC
jgi:hypothetical protein